MDKIREFENEVAANIENLGKATEFQKQSLDWQIASGHNRYSYNFAWMGRPIIQYPQDIMALQELIWRVKPDLIIETGVAHGGSLVFSSSMLELLGGHRQVIGIDIDIRAHNRQAIEEHPMAKRIKLVQGSSVSEEVLSQVKALAVGFKNPMVILDSNHTHEHVLEELKLYSPFVKKDSYLIVMDTIIEDAPEDFFPDRSWGKGNNPKTAVWQFVKENGRFEIDKSMQHKLMITVCPDGFLRCIKD